MIAERLLKAEKEKRVVYGAKQVLTLLKLAGAEEVFVLANSVHLAEAERLAALSGIKLTKLDVTNEELSSQLKKLFGITIAAIKKGK